ncbi:MAG: hypothetical protein WB471_02340 [Nocardioides sp.]
MLARPAAESAPTKVRVVQLDGSVLFDVPLRGADHPTVLRPGRPQIRIQIIVRDAGRCDPHSLGQSTRTFLFRVFVRLGGGRELSRLVVPTVAQRRRLSTFLDLACTVVS